MNHSDSSTTWSPEKAISRRTNEQGILSQIFMPILKPLASLRLTVALLILSVFVIWVATLQQLEHDIWAVKRMHFPSLVVYIPFYTFLPPAWFPEWRTALQAWQIPLPGSAQPIGMLIPSGFAVILAMLVNLTAAHTLRFRIQAEGSQRLYGGIVTLVGLLFCAGVVWIGQSNGLQNQPPIEYSTMWMLTLAVMALCGLGAGWFGMKLESHRVVERVVAFSLGLLLVALPVLLLVTGASIGDSGMRILWQIAQCSAASVVLLGGLMFLFRRKAGIVLLHAGLILLLGNEIWVTLNHEEQRLSGMEGDTVAHTIDIRETELVLVERQGDQDRLFTIPSRLLEESAKLGKVDGAASGDKTLAGVWIPIPETELEVRCLEFYRNSDMESPGPDNLANKGIGLNAAARPLNVVSGVDTMAGTDTASAYIQLKNSAGADLGTFLVSQFQRIDAPIFAKPNVVENGDKRYAMRLWFKRFFKPYEVTIESIESMDYPGTKIPRWYSTEFRIVDHETGYSGTQKVWMNNPLRYRNETFYQSGYAKDPNTGQESTTLQVVRNRGWMIPYLCCAMVSIGLLAQFMPIMLTYTDKRQRQSLSSPKPRADDGIQVALPAGQTSSEPGWKVPIIAASIVGLIFIGWAYPKKPKQDSLNLTSLASMPISYKGRIQPLDSLARTNLRKTIGLESAKSSEMTFFGTEKKYPAIVWLADSIFTNETSGKYRVFRVVNPDLLQNLHLAARSGFRYTSDEINESLQELRVLDSAARDKAKENRSTLDKAVLDLASKLAETQTIVHSLGGPNTFIQSTDPDRELKLYEEILSAAGTKAASNMPGVVPGTEPMAPWLTLDEAAVRLKLEELADDLGTEDAEILSAQVINRAIAQAMLDEPVIRSEMAEQLAGMSEKEQLSEMASRLQNLTSNQIKQFLAQFLGIRMEAAPRFVQMLMEETEDLMGGRRIQRLTETQKKVTRIWLDIKAAYLAQDQQRLDQSVAAYNTTLRESANVEIPWGKVRTEYQLSGWAPFYVASVISLLVCVVSVPSLLGLARLRKFSFLLQCLSFLLITIGLIVRIYISGRAPVTSIYSSAIGIAWGCVLGFLILEAITKRGIGNVLGGLAGYTILLTAYGLSLTDDKFSVLRAVLDTQFWLWTHVTCVALGYVLTLLAGLWSCVILFSAAQSDRKGVKEAADLTYGIIAAATILSFVGTVLGGLWADDSWGRFWGWDPKENGAAMIVLWNAAVLHARWAGLIRYRGLMVMAIMGNMITLWSWFAVNELGVGLHSYGFTEGVITFLTVAWIAHLLIAAAAFLPFSAMSARKPPQAKGT